MTSNKQPGDDRKIKGGRIVNHEELQEGRQKSIDKLPQKIKDTERPPPRRNDQDGNAGRAKA